MPESTDHPVWCSPEHCTAPAGPVAEDAGGRGEHRSRPMPLAGIGLLELTEAVAPWKCATYVAITDLFADRTAKKLGTHYQPISVPLDDLFGALTGVLGEIRLEPCAWADQPHDRHTYEAAPGRFLPCPGAGPRDEPEAWCEGVGIVELDGNGKYRAGRCGSTASHSGHWLDGRDYVDEDVE